MRQLALFEAMNAYTGSDVSVSKKDRTTLSQQTKAQCLLTPEPASNPDPPPAAKTVRQNPQIAEYATPSALRRKLMEKRGIERRLRERNP